jgi:tetratricopeptide (TPR) repeat protein
VLAIRYFDRAIELDPTHAASHLNKGFAMTALKKHTEAEECFKRASELAHAKSSIKI